MKHIDKTFGVNLNAIERNHSDQDKKALTEGINIFILIALGCAGLFLYSNILSSKKASFHSGITANTNLVAVEKEEKAYTEVDLKHTQLLVDGHKEVGERLTFVIDSYDPKAQYTIDFGNGKQQEVKKKKVTYTYQESGNYLVKMDVRYKNESPVEFSQKIYIDTPIEVSEAAYLEK